MIGTPTDIPQARTLPFGTRPCACCRYHTPKPLEVELHHIFPQTDQIRITGRVGDQRLLPLCRTAHRNLHVVLEAMLTGKPYAAVNAYTLEWAKTGLGRIRAAEMLARGAER